MSRVVHYERWKRKRKRCKHRRGQLCYGVSEDAPFVCTPTNCAEVERLERKKKGAV